MRAILAAGVFCLCTGGALAQSCGGNFSAFVGQLKQEASAKGHSKGSIDAFFDGVQQDQRVLRADRSQGVFKRSFTDFSRRLISQDRLRRGQSNAQKYASIFRRAEAEYGVPAGVLLAFWALETDYGSFQGDFNTRDALTTLSHDCRRPQLFRPQVFAALELFERGGFDPRNTKGAWAGEIGMVQMLPGDILENGVDADGNGTVDLKTSVPDALISGAKMLRGFGWRAGEPWLVEITVPDQMDWSKTGLDHAASTAQWQAMGVRGRAGRLPNTNAASVILPQGRRGPAFLAYPNFRSYFEWNQSFVYVTTAAYFATRLSGAQVFDARNPEPGLNDGQMKRLQQKLQARGHDVGKIDGILGARTRAAVQSEQARLGLPADAWPTRALLDRL